VPCPTLENAAEDWTEWALPATPPRLGLLKLARLKWRCASRVAPRAVAASASPAAAHCAGFCRSSAASSGLRPSRVVVVARQGLADIATHVIGCHLTLAYIARHVIGCHLTQ